MCGLMATLVASLLASSPGGLEILTIDTGDAWANSTISAIPGHNVTTISAAGIGGIDFNLFDVLYVSDTFSNFSTPAWASELIARGPDIGTYINGGGFVIVGVQAFGGSSRTNGDEYNFLPSGLVDGQPIGTLVDGNDVVITDPVSSIPGAGSLVQVQQRPSTQSSASTELSVSGWHQASRRVPLTTATILPSACFARPRTWYAGHWIFADRCHVVGTINVRFRLASLPCAWRRDRSRVRGGHEHVRFDGDIGSLVVGLEPATPAV